jgi:hypothetical protein
MIRVRLGQPIPGPWVGGIANDGRDMALADHTSGTGKGLNRRLTRFYIALQLIVQAKICPGSCADYIDLRSGDSAGFSRSATLPNAAVSE